MLLETLTCLTADLREASRSSWKRAKNPREAVCVSVLHSRFNRYSLPLPPFHPAPFPFLTFSSALSLTARYTASPLAFLLSLTLVSSRITQMTALQGKAYSQT